MRFSIALISLMATISAAPIAIRQGAGVGQGCDAILADGDTMIGESVRGAGKDVAGYIPSSTGNAKRQGAGVGQGCDAILADGDTMIGESVRGAGKDVANSIPSGTGNAGNGDAPATGGLPAGLRRQLNGIADGLTAPGTKFAATKDFSDNMDTFLNNVDDDGTQDSAEFGEDVGAEEVNLGNTIGGQNGESGGTGGGAAPAGGQAGPAPGPGPAHGPHKRQLNGIADGLTAPLEKVGATQQLGENEDTFLNNVDNQGTQGSAEFGEAVGAEEVEIGNTVGGQNGEQHGNSK